MSAIYGCTAEIHLPPPKVEILRVIENLGRRLEWVCDAQLEQESTGDGTIWLNVHCPEQNCGHAFIEDLDAAFAELARHAIEGFAVDYVYEGDRGADFHGPTAEAKALAKRNWNFARAAYYLEQEGIDLHRLLELPVASSAVLERFVPPDNIEQIIIWADRDENGAGQRSAEVLRKNLEAKGIKASTMLPAGSGMDWLDVLNRCGVDGFPIRRNDLADAA